MLRALGTAAASARHAEKPPDPPLIFPAPEVLAYRLLAVREPGACGPTRVGSSATDVSEAHMDRRPLLLANQADALDQTPTVDAKHDAGLTSGFQPGLSVAPAGAANPRPAGRRQPARSIGGAAAQETPADSNCEGHLPVAPQGQRSNATAADVARRPQRAQNEVPRPSGRSTWRPRQERSPTPGRDAQVLGGAPSRTPVALNPTNAALAAIPELCLGAPMPPPPAGRQPTPAPPALPPGGGPHRATGRPTAGGPLCASAAPSAWKGQPLAVGLSPRPNMMPHIV